MKRILAGGNALKALGCTRSSNEAVRVFSVSLDQPSRPCEHVRRNYHTNLLCCLKVDNKLEFRRLLHWQIGGLGSLENPVYEICDAPVLLGDVIPVRHEAARMDIL